MYNNYQIKSKFSEVVENGQFFFPAYSHYGTKTNVVCDRCKKTNLVSCIGYDTLDLCLPCAGTVTEMLSKNIVNPISIPIPPIGSLTKMEQNSFKPVILTEMQQNMFKSKSNPLTRMQQSIFDTDNNNDDESNLTFMMQSMFNPNERGGNNVVRDRERTYMAQGMFNN
ncbi:MAG: hypothetical protein Terrestrivirus1_56 [Terrestrivirus sp.]|uniref:Uncharacterized protein n=1 Tax=Terrestrivirus sp. TaxID=2487775 RepID=A0A3G4ZK24_9VIRU|nr:MAG: hypothetical protein Terrestrivirus1_56 [Terrestrivirus sp.]